MKAKHQKQVRKQRLEAATWKFLGESLVKRTYQLNDIARVARINRDKHTRQQREFDDAYLEEASAHLSLDQPRRGDQAGHQRKINKILKKAQAQQNPEKGPSREKGVSPEDSGTQTRLQGRQLTRFIQVVHNRGRSGAGQRL